MLQCGKPFPLAIQNYAKYANFKGLYFPHFTIFCNKTSQLKYKLRILFLDVQINFPNSKVCIIEEWSVVRNSLL